MRELAREASKFNGRRVNFLLTMFESIHYERVFLFVGMLEFFDDVR